MQSSFRSESASPVPCAPPEYLITPYRSGNYEYIGVPLDHTQIDEESSGPSTAEIIASQSQDYVDEKLAEYQATIQQLQGKFYEIPGDRSVLRWNRIGHVTERPNGLSLNPHYSFFYKTLNYRLSPDPNHEAFLLRTQISAIGMWAMRLCVVSACISQGSHKILIDLHWGNTIHFSCNSLVFLLTKIILVFRRNRI